MNFAMKRGWVPALVAAVLAIMVWIPADPITEILTFVLIFALTLIVLLVVSRFTNVPAASVSRQRLVSWLVAFLAAVLVCLYPLIYRIVKG